MNIAIPVEIEAALDDAARRQGTTAEQLAVETLRERFVSSDNMDAAASSTQSTLADRLAPHLGILASSEHVPGGARASQSTGRRFTEIVRGKHRREQP